MSASGRFRWRFILNMGDKKKGGNLPAKGKVATKIMCVEWIIPQQQPEQQPSVRWAHGRESSSRSSGLPCGRT